MAATAIRCLASEEVSYNSGLELLNDAGFEVSAIPEMELGFKPRLPLDFEIRKPVARYAPRRLDRRQDLGCLLA